MTQCDAILTHLKRHGKITPLDALQQYGCFRLAARIYDLRSKGHRIETDNGEFATYRYHSRQK